MHMKIRYENRGGKMSSRYGGAVREYFRGVKRILDQCEIQIYDLSSRFKGRGESIDEFMKDVYTPPKPPKVNIFEKKFERQQMLEWDRKRTVFKMSMSDTEEQ